MEKRILRIVVTGLLFLSTCKSVFAVANPTYPRTGNIWGISNFTDQSLTNLARIPLWMGSGFSAEEITSMRAINPHILILTSINAVEHPGLPYDDYYLKDVNGKRIEVWPGYYRLNMTKSVVAEYQAQYAYQRMEESGQTYDGVFFDNVMTTQSWLKEDIYGNPVQIDADEDGVADDPATLNAAWKAGVFHELRTFRQLMPGVIAMGHSLDINEPGIAEIFNGIGFNFLTADVREGETSFVQAWKIYNDWMVLAKSPQTVFFEASPPDQIAYGYGYGIRQGNPSPMPASTYEFARTLYPYMRFGLCLALMNNGYFAYEMGDIWHGNDWWYDELDFNLGYPLGPARRLDLGFNIGPNRIAAGTFEDSTLAAWDFGADPGYVGNVARDTTTAAEGNASARINITSAAGVDWKLGFYQSGHSLIKEATYDLTFWAKSNVTRTITLEAQKNAPDWDNYGLWEEVTLSPTWKEYTITFESNATSNDVKIKFLVGAATGTVWLDDVRLTLHPPDVYQREFTNGLVLLNGTKVPQTVAPGSGYRRLTGNQAPLFEKMIDDSESAFSMPSGSWSVNTYDSGEWKAIGPFYHSWGSTSHLLTSTSGEARWTLPIPAADDYTITAWWPAAPAATGWNQSVLYQVIAGGNVVASATLSQRTGGDEWHTIGTATISPASNAYVRLTCSGSSCVADALYIRSKARYNDGSLAQSVTLQPLDGIILQRDSTVPTPTPASECSLKPKGDANCDGIINILDFETWRREFLGIDSTTKADFDSVGGVTILDFEIWRRGFLSQ